MLSNLSFRISMQEKVLRLPNKQGFKLQAAFEQLQRYSIGRVERIAEDLPHLWSKANDKEQ